MDLLISAAFIGCMYLLIGYWSRKAEKEKYPNIHRLDEHEKKIS